MPARARLEQSHPRACPRRTGRAAAPTRRSRRATRGTTTHARLETELDVIMKMGFPGYFLIVADFINWAKQQRHSGRPGPRFGRRIAGRLRARASPISIRCATTCCSSASSIPNACRCRTSTSTSAWIGATRSSTTSRDKYGRDRVSQIITYGTMAAKAVLRDTGRVLGMRTARSTHRQADPEACRSICRSTMRSAARTSRGRNPTASSRNSATCTRATRTSQQLSISR